MHNDIIFLVLAALAGISLMAYASVFSRRMRVMGEDLPRRVASRMLGEETSPGEIAEALEGLRRRFRLAGLAFMALSVFLLACAFLPAWLFAMDTRPLILAGLAVAAFSLSVCAFTLMDNIPLQ